MNVADVSLDLVGLGCLITVGTSGIAVDLRQEGLGSVLRDMMAPR